MSNLLNVKSSKPISGNYNGVKQRDGVMFYTNGIDKKKSPINLGSFEMYILGMWNDGMVVTMKEYDEDSGTNRFILLVPDGSEQLMTFSAETGFTVQPYRAAHQGRFAYLLDFLCGLKYKGYQGYEEYDEEEKMIFGIVRVGEKSLTYGGKNLQEVKADFEKVIEEAIR